MAVREPYGGRRLLLVGVCGGQGRTAEISFGGGLGCSDWHCSDRSPAMAVGEVVGFDHGAFHQLGHRCSSGVLQQ